MQIHSFDDWFQLNQQGIPVIDARSPSEFLQGHFPGAFNIPLLNDDERKQVGICYKGQGHDAAVRLGFKLTGHQFADKIELAEELIPQKELLIYCWRGGLRSQILSWILEVAGFKVNLLQGGYKTFRQRAHELFALPRKINLLSGRTGSGKTEILHALSRKGEFILDIEGIAHHKGSSFGALGQEAQPTQEHFENHLALALIKCSLTEVLWIEDESRYLGRVRIPDSLLAGMTSAKVFFIERTLNERANKILQEYGHFPLDLLAERTLAISKRMGSEQAGNAAKSLMEGDKEKWIELLLHYYDSTYDYCLTRSKKNIVATIEYQHEEVEVVAEKIIRIKEQ